MLPPCDGCWERQPLDGRSPGEMYLNEPPPGSLSLFFWFPEICTAKPTGLLPAWMMAPFPIVPVKQRRKKKEEKTKQNRKEVWCYHWRVPFYLHQIFSCLTTTFNCVCHPLRGGWRGAEGSGTVALPRLVRRASLCQYHCASPALLTLLNRILLRDTFSREAQGLPEWI